ncbi:polysaccharide deacetylase family protein [Jhaorihella thermophila]
MPPRETARRSVLILHGIGAPERALEPGEARFWLSREEFCHLLDRVAAMGDRRPVLTFDDGNASDAKIALPELERRGLRAMFFILTDRIDRPGSVSAGDVRALARAGMTVGLHGAAHRDWRRLDAAGREAEFRQARARLEDLTGQPVTLAAAPFGLYDRRVASWLKREGFEALYTSDRGLASDADFLRCRNCVERDMTATDVERCLRGSPSPLRRLRGWAGRARRRLFPLRVA